MSRDTPILEGDVYAFGLPGEVGFAVAILVRHRRGKKRWDEHCFWYGFNRVWPGVPRIEQIADLRIEHAVCAAITAGSNFEFYKITRIGRLPGFTREAWPLIPGTDRCSIKQEHRCSLSTIYLPDPAGAHVYEIPDRCGLTEPEIEHLGWASPHRDADDFARLLHDHAKNPAHPSRLRITDRSISTWQQLQRAAESRGWIVGATGNGFYRAQSDRNLARMLASNSCRSLSQARVGDVAFFPLAHCEALGAAILVKYRRARSWLYEEAMWYGFDVRLSRPPTAEDLRTLSLDRVSCFIRSHSPRAASYCERVRLVEYPGYTPESWPIPIGNNSDFGAFGSPDKTDSSDKAIHITSESGDHDCRVDGLFGLREEEYYRLSSWHDFPMQALAGKIEILMLSPDHPARLRVTPESLEVWRKVRERARAQGLLPPEGTPPDNPSKNKEEKKPRGPAYPEGRERTLWPLIEWAVERAGTSRARFLTAVEGAMSRFTVAQCRKVRSECRAALRAARTWDMWGAAYILNGGCSDDGFLYFRFWLLTRGRKAFEAAVNDPDTLVDVPLTLRDHGDCEFEELLDALFEDADPDEFGLTPKGRGWDIEDPKLRRERLPRLTKKHG